VFRFALVDAENAENAECVAVVAFVRSDFERGDGSGRAPPVTYAS
jgi:hypothetical protein